MLINDRVYGEVEVEEPVLLELMDSEPVKRTRGIMQFSPAGTIGYPYPSYTREEHGIGVMLLLKKLGASLEEQVKGLIHDIPHLAMAHIGEWALGYRNEDYHDTRFEKVVMDSKIPEILKRHSQSLERILNDEGFNLLEREIPELCADRVDYALREITALYNRKEGRELASHVINNGGRVCFDSKESAKRFGNWFLTMQTSHWGSAKCVVIFDMLGKTMSYALKEGILVQEDLEQTDKHVADKLFASDSTYVQQNLRILSNGFKTKKNLANPQYKAKKKFRYVDPTYVEDGRAYHLSESDPDYRVSLEWHRKVNERGISVDLIVHP